MNTARKMVNAPLRAFRFVKLYSQHLPQAFDAIFSMPVAVTKLQGRLKGRDERITLLYVGRRMNYDYLLRMIFDEHSEIEYVRSNLVAYRKYMERMSQGSDVVVLDLGWPYNSLISRKGGYAEIPDWMNLAIEFPERWDDVVLNFRRTARKHDLRLIRRNGYRCEVVNTREAIETFYDEMYLPFVQRRHADETVIAPRSHVIRQAMKGQLLRILRGSDVVAAGVIYPEDEIIFSLWMGMPRNHLEPQAEAAISALYFFGIRYAFENGYEAFDFTGTRAFLKDGVYQFKRRWGPLVSDEFSPNSILIKPQNGNGNAALFCQQVPVFRRTPYGLEALFARVDEPAGKDTVSRLEKDFGCAGLDRVTVIEVSEENETTTISNVGDKCQYRLIKCRLDRFADCYVNAGDPELAEQTSH